MSKVRLNKFLSTLNDAELKEQIQDLYQRFKNVKEFYDFSFNPNEDKRIHELKLKISKEYFPTNKRRAKKRRSIAQKGILHLQQLEVSPEQLADVMLYNIEIAQSYSSKYKIYQESFYKSILNSFTGTLKFLQKHGLAFDFKNRVEGILEETKKQGWHNVEGFELAHYHYSKNE